MIFPKLNLETVLQVEDATRFDAHLSFATNDENITDVLIEPETAAGFFTIYNSNKEKWFLDWAYETSGIKTVTVRVVADSGTKDKTYSVNVLTEAEDALLSDDNDLFPFEPKIHNYLPKGKISFLYAHRKAQDRIIAFLDEQRIWKDDTSRYTKQDLIDIPAGEFQEQFRQWSSFQTLLIIFESFQVSRDDIFQEKKMEYQNLMEQARNRSSLRLDQDGDSVIDTTPYNIRSTELRRR